MDSIKNKNLVIKPLNNFAGSPSCFKNFEPVLYYYRSNSFAI